MFTGIIEEIGTIATMTSIGENQVALSVKCRSIQDDMKLGDSVAVNGICLTVVKFDSANVTFEISSETIRHSTFANQKTGARVNLERALKLNDRLGGHIVQGHVDCVSKVKAIRELGGFFEIDFELPAEIKKYVVQKGSITIDGISLTIAGLADSWFRVAVIPHTYEQTVLKDRSIGDTVHLETDVIARYIERMLFEDSKDSSKAPITKEFLKKHGF